MDLYFRKIGSGPPLIIVHGLYGSSDNWISVGKALSDQFTVYLVDQRNHGQSPHSDVHDYPSMRDDLLGFMDSQEIEKAILIGHSMGGKTTMFLSESNPERIESLIVLDIAPTSYSGTRSTQFLNHRSIMEAMLGIDFKQVTSREDVDQQLGKSIPSRKIRNFLLKNVYRKTDQSFGWKLNLRALYASLDKVLDGLDASRYSGGEEIAGFPVLFIRGERSDYITDDDLLDIRQIYPMSRVSTLPDSGHWLHVEQPSLLVKTIRYFL
jgi:pimeloyl-ACP methyl ester carboxylesterase